MGQTVAYTQSASVFDANYFNFGNTSPLLEMGKGIIITDVYKPTKQCFVPIDFHPSSTYRIALIEIKNIHLYTYGDSTKAHWTPMMLELADVYYDEDFENLGADQKKDIIREFEVTSNQKKIIEFLYINGDDYRWGWGTNGRTNAAFIEEGARNYFRQFF